MGLTGSIKNLKNDQIEIKQKDQIAPYETFSQKATNKILMYLLVPFIV